MAKTDKELFDEVISGAELTSEDGSTVETEFVVDNDAEPVEEPEAVADETPEQETEPEIEAEADEEPEIEAEPEQEEAAEGDEKPAGVQIPKAQYDRIRAKQKAAEELASQREQENATLNGRLQQIERMLAAQNQPQAQQPQEPVEEPDPLTDPEAYARHIDARINQQVQAVERRFIQGSLDRARETFGEEAEKALAFVDQYGTPELAEAIRNSGDPGGQIVKYYRRQVALSEVGDDPAAYKEKLEAQILERMRADPAIRQELFNEMRGTASARRPDGSPAIKTAPSLAKGSRAADARPHTDDPTLSMSDAALFAQVTRNG